MEKEINIDVVKATQISLGKYVKRPPLTDKLLKKPPFRFLHDIITSVLKSTGFFSGLFEEEELISDNVKDRESTSTGQPLSTKPSKIIAGQEPERTNELLQRLALALDNNISSDEAVKLYNESVKLTVTNNRKVRDATSPVKKSTDSKKINAKSSDKSLKTVKSNNNTTKLKQKENNNVKKETQSKKSSTNLTSKKVSEKAKQTNDINKQTKNPNNETTQFNDNLELAVDQNSILAPLDISNDTEVTPEVNADSNSINIEYSPSQESPQTNDEHEEQSQFENNIIENNLSTSNTGVLDSEHQENKYEIKGENTNLNNEHQQLPNKEQPSPSIQKTEVESVERKAEKNNYQSHNIVHTHEKKNIDSSIIKRPSSVRPSSSRPGAPRFREKHDSVISNAENLVGGKVNIIAEKTVNEEEDEATIVIIDETADSKNMKDEDAHLHTSSDQHGHLVQQILDAQKEFTQAQGKTEIEWHFGAQKARDVLNQEIEQMRFNIQALSRVANPLGKLLDHIQEDVEVMRQELQQWIIAYEHASKELLKQKVANEEYLLPLHARIKQLDVDIAEKHDKINDLKIIIHKNASRIDKLLSTGNV